MIRTIYDIRHLVIILAWAALLVTHAQNPILQTQMPPGGVPLEPLCESDAEIPDDLIQCGSCRNRCGTKTNPYDLKFGGNALCSCDELCGYHDDCCRDFQELCPMEFENMQGRIAQYSSTFLHTDFECTSFYGDYEFEGNLVIHTCPDGSKCEFTRQINEDVNTFVPMYDVHRGVHYISGQCALCNGAREVEPWRVTLGCGAMDEHKDYVNTGIINSTESLTDIKNSGNCFKLSYSINREQRPCFNPVVSSCKEGCQNQNLVSLCESGYQSLTILKVTGDKILGEERVYRNAYCAACNAADGYTSNNLMCSGDFHRNPSVERPPPVVSFSLTLVFDFDPRNGLVVGKLPTPECAAEEVYVPQENICRAITCSPGFVLDEADCIPEPSNITAIVSGTFSDEPTSKIADKLNQEKFDLETKLTNKVVGILYSFNITYQNLIVAVTMGFYNQTFTITNRIHCNCDFSPLGNNQPLAARFDNSVTRGVKAVTTDFLLSRDIKIDFDLLNVSVVQSQQMGCTWLVYQLNETQTGNGTITIITTGKTYASGMFQIVDKSTVIVCETDLSRSIPDEEISDVDLALSIVTVICIGISIICLVIRITLQLCVSSFRNRPGRLRLQLAIAFLIAFLMLIVGVFLSDFPEACTTAAILLAYGFLAAFIWMNIIAVDTWLAFRPSAAFSRADDEGRSLVLHYLLGWGIPLLLVAVSIVINYTSVDGKFNPEFGGSRCWYTQRYAMLLYFGLPITLSMIINITLYTWTSINLHKAFKSRADMIKRKRYHFFVYVRLFILMGITWIFGFISAFTDEIVIDFIFVILTSLQGLSLFISIVCNKRVLSEIKQKIKSETSTSGKQTKSTTLPSLNSESARESKI